MDVTRQIKALAGDSQAWQNMAKVWDLVISNMEMNIGDVPQAIIARTRVLKNSQNPRWDENFNIPLAHPVEYLKNICPYGPDLTLSIVPGYRSMSTEYGTNLLQLASL
ncbi:hypothetical protein RIF29_15348 [Crotalaria pallida]|uniref:C2 domain-containing protein n=1 Tax=Crotalaria pallida TaxID=3830 RepID=A0AAN9FEQ1_CROPI